MITCLSFVPHLRRDKNTLSVEQKEMRSPQSNEGIKPWELAFSQKGFSYSLMQTPSWKAATVKQDISQLDTDLQRYVLRSQDERVIISSEAKAKLLCALSDLSPARYPAVLSKLNKTSLCRDILSLFILNGDLKAFLKFYEALNRSQKEGLWRLFKDDLSRLQRLEVKLLSCFKRYKRALEGEDTLQHVHYLKDLFKYVLLLTTWSRIPLFLFSFEEGQGEVFDRGLMIHTSYKKHFTQNFAFLGQIRSLFTQYQSEDLISDIEPVTLLCSA